jgi:tRNA(Ile)-lysidine synthetase-like protein
MEYLYEYWKNNQQLWFLSSPDDDKNITEKFNHLLNIKHKIEDLDTPLKWTSYVILYDQILKHINRHIINSELCINNQLINLPFNFIENCYIKYIQFKYIIDDFEFIFMLMPIRHTHLLYHVKFVLNETWERLEKNKDNSFLKKYLIATYERYIKCSSVDNQIENIVKYEPDNNQNIIDYLDILDNKCINIKIDTKLKMVNNHKLIELMKSFIIDNKLNDKTIVISISGGVDSMVCSYLLKMINHPFIALHIDYYNRDECIKEEGLLKAWCSYLNIPLYIRRIDEINRNKCMQFELRDLYESYTKHIRFNSYINYNNNIDESYIMLGHNKDDTIENILTNTATNSHYENLLGMKSISYQPHLNKIITFIRPLLKISKKDIYDFALNYNIPFLLDSTPKWSQRGIIRDIVRPALEEWNPLILDGLIALSEKMSNMTKLLDKLILPDINFHNIKDVPTDVIYWTTVFKKRNIYITNKTMKCLIEKIILLQKNEYKLQQPQQFTLCKNHYIEFYNKKYKLNININ